MAIDLSLDRIRELLAVLPVPYTRPTIHIAGTNGKGSVCAYVSSILSAAAPPIVVGRFNSPHLLTPLDGICIQNKPVSEGLFSSTKEEVERINKEKSIGASSFELLTAQGLLIFERTGVDVVVLEVGMGGRLDATNVVPDSCILASALTAVDLDHQAFLGDTIELITREKAAIARSGKPFVLGPQVHRQAETVARSVVEAAGGEVFPSCSVTPVDRNEFYAYEGVDGPHGPSVATGTGVGIPPLQPVQISMPCFADPVRALLPLHGEHQYGNLGTAAGLVSALLTHPSCQYPGPNFRERLTPTSIAQGIKATRWPGRLSYHTVLLPPGVTSTGDEPSRMLVLADGAHNPASAAALAAYLSSPASPLTSPTSTSGDKPLCLTYVLGLSHSPPKTPAKTLEPLFAIHPSSSLAKAREVRVGAAVLSFAQPAGMPWIRAVPPSDIRAAIKALNPAVEVYEAEKAECEKDTATASAGRTNLASVPRGTAAAQHGTDSPLERALRWAASRRRPDEDALVVLAGSLYLVADFYRLLQRLGQADEIWGAN